MIAKEFEIRKLKKKCVIMLRKMLSKVVASMMCAAFIFTSVPVFASTSSLPIADGIDLQIQNPNRTPEDEVPPIRERLNWDSHWYYSPSFTSGIWIGSQKEFINSKGLWFIRPYQSNIEQPWASISQAWDAATNTVRSRTDRHGSNCG